MSSTKENTHLVLSSETQELFRDLTLSKDLPLVFCIRLLLRELQWKGQISELVNLLGRDPRDIDLVDARNLLLQLGFNSKLDRLNDLNALKRFSLPALYISPENQPYTLISKDKFVFAGNAFGRFDIDQISFGGFILSFDDIKPDDNVLIGKQMLYHFSSKISVLYWISFGISLLALALPLYIRAIYNIAIPSGAMLSSVLLFIGIGFLFFLDFNMRQWRTNLLSQMVGKLDSLLGMKVVQKFLALDYSQIKNLNLSTYSTRVRNLDGMLNYLKGPLALALLEFPFIIIYLIAVGLIVGNLVFVPILIMLISGLIVMLLSKFYSVSEELNIKTSIGILQAQQELVTNFKEVKLAHLEWVWVQRIRALSGESSKSGLILNKQAGILQILISTSAQLAGVLTLAFGAWILFTSPGGNDVLGDLIAAMFIVWRVFTPFQSLMNALLRFDTIKNQYYQLDRFLKLRSSTLINRDFNNSKPLLFGTIQLDSVSSRNSSGTKLSLTKINLKFAPGDINAVTGNPGSGKTSLLNVISQLLPVAGGNLLFNGIDHRQFTSVDIQNNISYVMSNSQFLPGTLWENLTAMNPDAPVDGVMEICEMVGVCDFISNLHDGFDTCLNYDFSSDFPLAIRRLLSLAQALIKDSPILLIDDISHGLSVNQFQNLVTALPRMRRCSFSKQDRSIILTTSNNLLLQTADYICILDKGVSTFQGTQEQLAKLVQIKA